MRSFKSLQPEQLPDEFDVEIQTEEPIVHVEESETQIQISYTFPGFYVVDVPQQVEHERQKFQLIEIQSTGNVVASGKPLIPSFGRYLQIPPNMDFKLRVEKGNPVVFDNVIVVPAQEHLMDAAPPEKHKFEFDKSFYMKDTLYPKEVVEVSGPSLVHDYNAVLVHVRPLQYNPAKHELIGYGNITVTLTLVPKAEDRPAFLPTLGTDQQGLGNLFLNPGSPVTSLGTVTGPVGIGPIKPPIIDPTQYLIVYADEFKAAAQKLADWKNERGLKTQIVPISKIGKDVPKLKTYLRGRRGMPFSALRYVLLLGDVDMIPSEKVRGGTTLTDLYYSTPTDYQANKPSLIFAWLALGRIPVRTPAEALEVVNQIIDYEKHPPTKKAYYKKMTVAGYFEADHDYRNYIWTMEEIVPTLVNDGYEVERIYTASVPASQLHTYYNGHTIPAEVKAAVMPPAAATAALIKATSDGRLIIGHRDHGSPDGWYQPPFGLNELNQVTGTMPTVFFSINCQTGKFDYQSGTTPQECFAEKNLRMKGTAPSLIAATRNTNTFQNNALIKALFDAMFAGVIPTFPAGSVSSALDYHRLGDMLNYARSYLPLVFAGDPDGIMLECELYHVIGDPTLELWKEAPLPMKVTAVLARTNLIINLSACPKGTVLTIWSQNKLLSQIWPSTTHLVVSLKNLLPTHIIGYTPPITVCCWAPAHRFVEAVVETRVLHPELP
jgi:hypothetical protein